MITRSQRLAGTGVAVLTLLAITTSPSAPPQKKIATAARSPATNVIPPSVFVAPTNPAHGRDPFFPNHLFGAGSEDPKHAASSHADVALVLNGLSGTLDHRLAMINGRTMAEGEESEVPTSVGRVKVRCVQIKADSGVIEIGGERR